MKSRQVSDSFIKSLCTKVQASYPPFLCTPHDEKALNFLENSLGVDAYKIGSGEVENWPFIKMVAETKNR